MKIFERGEHLILLEDNSKRLVLILTEQGRRYFKNKFENRPEFNISETEEYDIMYDIFQDIHCNSAWEYTTADHIAGNLSQAPCFVPDGLDYEDDHPYSLYHQETGFYYYGNYQVQSFIEELYKEGLVTFDKSY